MRYRIVVLHKHSLIWILIFSVIALMFVHLPPMVAKQDSILNTYGALVEVDALIKQRWVEPIRGETLVNGAIRGMLFQLDPYSGYIGPDELHAFERQSSGQYVGVGVELGMKDGQLTVIAPIEGSPAAQAGVLPGDVIVSVNGHEVVDRSVFDVEEMLVGEPGTVVRLRLRHPGRSEPDALTVVRNYINIPSVRGFARTHSGRWRYRIDPTHSIAYIRVSNFRHNTMTDFNRVLARLEEEGIRGLIIDLRFNPGGLMHPAIEMVDRFVDQGIILSTVNRYRAVDEYRATRRGTIGDIDLVVLINASSASSSEIVAGSLQSRGRAIVVGERSFGKGSVQQFIPLRDQQTAVKLTVAYYRLPDGRIIHRTARQTNPDSWGVIPDMKVSLSKEQTESLRQSRRALDLAFTESSTAKDEPKAQDDHVAPIAPPAGELIHDAQLSQALTLLRATLAGRTSARLTGLQSN
ncbi:MAG: S41 family peptidase [Gemmatimonadetes bacterium]|nr:S41 family peptidase [Gemmatimonadota bacterium]